MRAGLRLSRQFTLGAAGRTGDVSIHPRNGCGRSVCRAGVLLQFHRLHLTLDSDAASEMKG